ncbi:MAG TPA: hypothetical protein VFY06_04310 [Verrucomicrobiae bacterium]|nr:hypothetical protein [Verrucomicrobiae bacterium]
MDGSASYNGDQALWYRPFNASAGPLLTYTIQPGTYSFRVINPAAAMGLFPSLTLAQAGQIFTAWTFNSPWVTDYLVFDNAASTNNTIPQLFDGAFSNTNGGSGNWIFYGNAGAAYTAAITNGFYNLIRTSATGGRDSTNVIISYTFNSATTLIFVIPDSGLYDNSGGVSVLISPANPLLAIETAPPGAVRLKWPTNDPAFNLESSTNLATTNWSAVLPGPVTAGGLYVVTNHMDVPQRFYRLHKP